MAQAGTVEKPKKAKRLEYRSGEDENGETYFNKPHNQKVAIERAAAFRATLSDEQNAALTALLKGMRDAVGWTSAGRILFKGSADRGN
jgi:hypothetical protein